MKERQKTRWQWKLSCDTTQNFILSPDYAKIQKNNSTQNETNQYL